MISFLRGKLVEKSATAAYIDVGGLGLEVNMSQIALSQLPDAGAGAGTGAGEGAGAGTGAGAGEGAGAGTGTDAGASAGEGSDAGADVFVQTYFHVREDAMQLFGFANAAEKQLFCELIGVSGIGPKVALAALSFFEPQVLAAAIVSEDVAKVSKIPGVGKKTAQRIILELKGTLEAQGFGALAGADAGAGGAGAAGAGGGAGGLLAGGGAGDAARNAQAAALASATEALLSMGFTQQEIELALRDVEPAAKDTTTAKATASSATANRAISEADLIKHALKRLGAQ